MRFSKTIGNIISFKRSLFTYKIIIPLSVISILFFNGIDSLASSSSNDVIELNSTQLEGESESAKQLQKEVREFYWPKLVMFFDAMNNILGINPLTHSQKEISVQEAEETEKLSGKVQVSDLRKLLLREDLTGNKEYYVQVGTWENLNYAERMLSKVKYYYPEVRIVVHNNLKKLRIPNVMTKKHGYIISRDIESKFNIKTLLVKKIQ